MLDEVVPICRPCRPNLGPTEIAADHVNLIAGIYSAGNLPGGVLQVNSYRLCDPFRFLCFKRGHHGGGIKDVIAVPR